MGRTFQHRCWFTSGLYDFHLLPGLVGIEPIHPLDELHSVVAEVLLVDDAIVVDEEGRDAGVAVFGGPGEQREAADHLALDDIAERPAGGIRALLREDAIVVAM